MEGSFAVIRGRLFLGVLMLVSLHLISVAPANVQTTSSQYDFNKIGRIPYFKQESCSQNCSCFPGNTSELVVDCSNRNFSELPQNIPSNAFKLLLNNNTIGTFEKGCFSNLTTLVHLNISYNKPENFSISEGIFENLTNLRILDMTLLVDQSGRYAKLPNSTFQDLPALQVLNISNWNGTDDGHLEDFRSLLAYLSLNLTDLQADGINGLGVLWTIKEHYFDHFSNNTELQYLSLRHNYIVSIRKGVLHDLRHLKHLDLSYNAIISGDFDLLRFNLPYMTRLEKLFMTYQAFVIFPRITPRHVSSHSKEKLMSKDSEDSFVGNASCQPQRLPPNLTELVIYCRNMVIQGTLLFNPCFDENNKLEKLDYSYNWLDRPLFGTRLNFPNLKYLSLRSSRTFFENPGIFSNLKKLEYLDISKCNLNDVLKAYMRPNKTKYELWQEMLKNHLDFRNLSYLNIAQNYFTYLPVNIFEKTPKLKYINISYNFVRNVSFRISHLTELEILNLTKTELKFIPRDVRKMWKQMKNFTVILAGNNFSCDCLNMDFVAWVNVSKHITFQDLTCTNQTVCYEDGSCVPYKADISSPEKAHDVYQNLLKQCKKVSRLHFFIYGTILFIILCVTTGLGSRWKFVYAWYFSKTLVYRDRQHAGFQEARYDAFVCYCQKDYHWVMNSLRPALEEQLGYTLCIHHRDFELGVPIDVNIMQAFARSRKIILVISNNSLRSRYLNFEVSLAVQRLEAICVLLDDLHKLHKRLVSPSLHFLLTYKTHIEWPRLEKRQRLFWLRLQHALGRPSVTSANRRQLSQNDFWKSV